MKSEQEIIWFNDELIARFMGGKSRKVIFCVFPDGTDVRWNQLKYHSSWEALMPVVEKIRSLGETVEISTFFYSEKHPINNGCRITYGDKQLRKFFFNENTDDLKKCIVESVVEFIKWYNKNKKS